MSFLSDTSKAQRNWEISSSFLQHSIHFHVCRLGKYDVLPHCSNTINTERFECFKYSFRMLSPTSIAAAAAPAYYYYYYYHYHPHHHHSFHLYTGYLNYILETNHVSNVYSVAAVQYLQSVLHLMLFRTCTIFCTFKLVLSVV